jgi:hypothetical protein
MDEPRGLWYNLQMFAFDMNFEPASHEQAEQMITWIRESAVPQGETTRSHGEYHGDIDRVPDEVAEHLPAPTPLTQEVKYTLRAVSEHDHRTHAPKTFGVLGWVAFQQKEKLSDNLTFVTRVGYRVINDGTDLLQVERHVTNNENNRSGPDTVAHLLALPSGVLAAHMAALPMRIAEAEVTERGHGMLMTDASEVQGVLDFCTTLPLKPHIPSTRPKNL